MARQVRSVSKSLLTPEMPAAADEEARPHWRRQCIIRSVNHVWAWSSRPGGSRPQSSHRTGLVGHTSGSLGQCLTGQTGVFNQRPVLGGGSEIPRWIPGTPGARETKRSGRPPSFQLSCSDTTRPVGSRQSARLRARRPLAPVGAGRDGEAAFSAERGSPAAVGTCQ